MYSIYLLVGTWCSDGWLRHLGANGVIDFAGGTVVHILGGMVGCVGAWIAGPRLGRFESNHTEETRAVEIPGHASVLAALGTLIIWYCWYGFNTGSTLGLSGDKWEIARRISVVTTLCASSASCTALMWRRITTKHWDINMLLNGILAGLVASTPGCAVLEPWAAVIVGSAYLTLFTISKLLSELCTVLLLILNSGYRTNSDRFK